jgi:GntR family transcriptional regulator, transcriptional repressor for pyruvate dehydrogenase complex
MDEELIRWCVIATRAACVRMTARHLKALQDSVGQACCLPAGMAWDRRAFAHAQIVNLLADVTADHPVPAMVLTEAVGTLYDLMVTVGPATNGMIRSSRRRLLALMRAGDADGAAVEMERHLRGLCFMALLSGVAEPDRTAV